MDHPGSSDVGYVGLTSGGHAVGGFTRTVPHTREG